jgi:hypothetical protein
VATGLYLYCLREAAATPSEINPATSGIKEAAVDGKGRVTVRAFEGVEAIVSNLSLDDFGEMQKKAQEDIHWITERAVAHEMVVEEAMGRSREALEKFHYERDKPANSSVPVIPIKFGVIFNTDRRLAEVISGQRAAIRATFDRIRGKQEWSVKLFLKDNQNFKNQVKQQSNKLREKSKELAALPAGMAYFMEEEFNEELERECSWRLEEEGLRTFDQLKPFAAEAAQVKLLDSKLTGRSERMVLNAAYLVALDHLPKFGNAVATLRENLASAGFLLEQSGPWPAYHFTEFAHD